MVEKAEERRRVRVAVKGQMSARRWNIQQLLDATDLDRSTVGDFLDGKRWPQSRTLAAIEEAIGWPPGTIAGMLEGDEAPPVGGDTEDPVIEENDLLYRRPDGISDAEWERIKEESRGFIEWQIEKASKER